MFKRKKQTEGQPTTARTLGSADDELNALLTRSTPRRPPAVAEPPAPMATVPAPTADQARRPATTTPARSRNPAATNGPVAATTMFSEGRKLIVGRDIHLTGEVTSCDVLVVEGRVELTRTDAKQIQVAASGLFFGTVDVDEAEVAGQFEGEMTVRDRLTVRAGGRVEGKIRYKNIVIEAGGHIAGDVGALTAETAAAAQPRPAPAETGPDQPANPAPTASPRPGQAAGAPSSAPSIAPDRPSEPALPRRNEPAADRPPSLPPGPSATPTGLR